MGANNCRQMVAELYNNGLTIKQIAETLGISISQVILEIHMLDDNELPQEKHFSQKERSSQEKHSSQKERFSDKVHERRTKVVELSNKGLSSEQIAQELGVSVATVYSDINIQSKRDIIEERRLKVAELYTKGLTAQEIAEELNVPVYTVYQDIRELIANGNICVKPNVFEERRQKIVELYNTGWTNTQIAKEMGISVTTVAHIISSIRKRPDIYKLVEPEGGRPRAHWNRTNVSAETLYNLRLGGLTNAEIAELLDASPSTIASIVSTYRKQHNLPYPSNSPNKSSECKQTPVNSNETLKPIHTDMSLYERDVYRLYKRGLSCEKIASLLGVSAQEVYIVVKTILNMQYLEEQKKLEKCNPERNKSATLTLKIVDLYNNGISYKDMAEQLNISISYVNALIVKAFKQGLIEHSRTISLDLMPNVANLYKGGSTYSEIATQLGITVNDVRNLLHAATKRGLVQLNPAHERIPEDVKKTLLQLRAQGKTMPEIAAATGQPYKRVYRYLAKSKDGTENDK